MIVTGVNGIYPSFVVYLKVFDSDNDMSNGIFDMTVQ